MRLLYEKSNRFLRNFVHTQQPKPVETGTGFNEDILYGPRSEVGLCFIDARISLCP